MDAVKGKSGMLMSKGVMQMKTDPPSFVCNIRVFRQASTGKVVTLHPMPNMAAPMYFTKYLDGNHTNPNFDVVLCEDGRLPYAQGTAEGRKQTLFKKIFPFLCYRPVVPPECTKFDGLIQRDPVESRMAYTSLVQSLSPTVDARARRAVERIESYGNNTRVVVPWNVYHHVYFSEKLPMLGFELVRTEEVAILEMKHIMLMIVTLIMLSFYTCLTLFRILFGF
jgi:hypothetical protein